MTKEPKKKKKGYSCASRGGSSWGAGRVRRRVWEENFWKYIDNSFKIAAGERWRSGNAGITGSFCQENGQINASFLINSAK